MKKIFTVLFLAFFAVFLSACSSTAIGGENSLVSQRIDLLNKQTEEGLAQTRLVQIFDAVASQDRDSIKSLFSPYAQENSERLDDAIEYLFTYVDGNIESWEMIGGNVSTSKSKGEGTVEYTYRFRVQTAANSYLVSITEYTKNSLSPQYIGLYSLVIFNALDPSEKEPAFWGPGVYMPADQLE